MSIITEAWVPGHARTKGSLTGKGAYLQDTPQSKRWRALMAEAVRQDIGRRHGPDWRPTMAPIVVEFACWLQPRAGLSLSPADGPATWSGAGDVDKLARNLLDALADDARTAAFNGGAFHNDNQVVRLEGCKYTANAEAPPGMWIMVSIDENQFWREQVSRHRAAHCRATALG